MNIFDQPLNFVKKVRRGKHIVLFYEETEYARIILFEFLKNGLVNKERCVYISEENVEAVEREMSDAGINAEVFMKNELLFVHQVPNLAGYSNITQTALENLSQFALRPWTKDGRPDRLVLRCIFTINSREQIRSNLEWEREFRAKDLKHLQGTMICTYPVSNIIPTISDSEGDYGRWMSDLLELYDGVIFARKFWTGVAFLLD
jgi:DcmR-like sensory protein